MKKKVEEQMSLFDSFKKDESTTKKEKWKLFIDGASRGNPGTATCGIVIYCNDVFFKRDGYFLGTMTNNQAEYMGLIIGLLSIKPSLGSHDTLTIISDSQLLVRQIQKTYKVKNCELVRLYTIACQLLQGLDYSLEHVLREYNHEADKVANEAFETKKKVPVKFVEMMKSYESIS